MYRIKLEKHFKVKITVPKGEKSGETKTNIDDGRIALANRGEIISSALAIESRIDQIICSLFFSEQSDSELFEEFILRQAGVNFHIKERALSRLLKAKRFYDKDRDREQLINKIRTVKETRNRFAHGEIGFDKSGVFLEYYDNGLKTKIIDDKYWKEVESAFNATLKLLSELYEKILKSRKQ